MNRRVSMPTLVLSLLLLSGLYSLQAQTFTASAYGSDYYIYFRWTAATNACVAFPGSQYTFKVNGAANNLFSVTYSGSSVPGYDGNDYRHAIGPDRGEWYLITYRHYGALCDYTGYAGPDAYTAPLRPPGALTATVDTFDNKVVLNWGRSGTDVPVADYFYRIFRDSVYMGAVPSSSLNWTDTSAVPGITYYYQVDAYAAAWQTASTRKSALGRVFNLNVRTESLASGVRIIWDRELSARMNYQRYTIERKDGNNAPEFLYSVNSPTATSWTDLNPLPGYAYTYIVTPDDGGSTTYRADSAQGSRLPDGSISGYIRAPVGGGGVQGVLVTVTRRDTVPQGAGRWTYTDTTDANGYYEVKDIYYYTDADFTIVPSLANHGFRAASEARRLNLSNHTITNVDFTDTSSFTIGCKVRQRFAGRTAMVKGVDIWVDGISRGYRTDASGVVLTTVAPIGLHSLSPRKPGHGFAPFDTSLNVTDNIDSLIFLDTTLYTLSGTVTGPCSIYVGTAALRVFDSAGTIDTAIQSDPAGRFSVRLPARDYKVSMTGFTPEGSAGVIADSVLAYFASPAAVSLDTSDARAAFIYRRPPTIHVTGIPAWGCGSTYDSVPIFEQARPETLHIEVRENFGAATCLVDTGFVVITHTLDGGARTTDTLGLSHGAAEYVIVAGAPEIIAPYLYSLEMTAHVGEVSDVYQTPVLVTGNRPRSQTYTTVSPGIPFTVLHDPPGDGSYSYFSESSEFNTSLKLSSKMDTSLNLWAEAKLGAEYEAGQFILTSFKAWGSVKNSFTVGASLAGSTELALKIVNSSKVSTSGNADVTGSKGDVFVGAALNLVYAITDVISYDTAACGVNKTKELIMGADGFNTTFMYTEDHVRNTLIPQLAEICTLYKTSSPDSAVLYASQINVWNRVLAYNDSLKANATLLENRSFSAGVPYESSKEVTTTATQTLDFTAFIENTVALEVGVEIGGSGASGGAQVTLRTELGLSSNTSIARTRTTGYALSDDDAGDFFSVDIKADPVYATPLFKLAAGRSSCPWEEGSQPRDGVQLTADTASRTGVPSTEAAVFVLKLANTSQSGEIRNYALSFLQESNPFGAIITVGGSQVQGGTPIPYTIQPSSFVNATVTVRKGPSAFDYRNLMFSLASPCDGSIFSELGLNVLFCDTCDAAADRAPVITTLALDSALANTAYSFTMQASDPDSDQVTWYLLRAPDSMRISVMSGLISWVPQDADIGLDTVVVRATDGVKSDTAQYLIRVNGSVRAERARPMPKVLSLAAAPNPFNPDVKLSVAVPLSEKAGLTVVIYDIRGRVLARRAIRGAGYHDFQWSGKDASGKSLPTGLYIARLAGGSKVLQKKLLMVK